jgi:hypothetical protein
VMGSEKKVVMVSPIYKRLRPADLGRAEPPPPNGRHWHQFVICRPQCRRSGALGSSRMGCGAWSLCFLQRPGADVP